MLAEAHTGEVYRSLSSRSLDSLTPPQRGRRHDKGTNGSLNHSSSAKSRRNGDVLPQDAEQAMGTGSENLRGTRSFHSSQRQATPATRRREAGHSREGQQRYAQGRQANGTPSRLEGSRNGWRAVYIERCPCGSVGGSQKPGLATVQGAGSPPNVSHMKLTLR